MTQHYDIIVVGAGPVAGLTALLLANRGANILILEKDSQLTHSPRALVYHPQVIGILEDAGIIDDVRRAGLTNNEGMAWRRASDHSLLAVANPSALKPDDPLAGPRYAPILLGQDIFAEIVHEKLKATGKAETRFGHEFKNLKQEGQHVSVTAMDSATGQQHEFSASFVLGADGARSSVRKALDIPFNGFTHDINLVSVNLRYSEIQATGFTNAQFLVDPAERVEDSRFAVVIRTGENDIWRCAYGDGPQYSDEELRARLPMKLKSILPLSPDPDRYEVVLAQPYRIHQRYAETYVQGRVLLAGDAAHINNPVGGLGMNTGLLDARVAADMIHKAMNLSDETQVAQALQEYNDIRCAGFVRYTNPTTIDNLRRLWEVSDEAENDLRRDFFEKMQNAEFQREVALDQNYMESGRPA